MARKRSERLLLDLRLFRKYYYTNERSEGRGIKNMNLELSFVESNIKIGMDYLLNYCGKFQT